VPLKAAAVFAASRSDIPGGTPTVACLNAEGAGRRRDARAATMRLVGQVPGLQQLFLPWRQPLIKLHSAGMKSPSPVFWLEAPHSSQVLNLGAESSVLSAVLVDDSDLFCFAVVSIEGQFNGLYMEDVVSLAEIKALIQEKGDRDQMPAEFNRRLLAVMQRDHAKAIKLIAELNAEIQSAAEQDDLKLAEKKQTVFARLLVSEAEMCRLIDCLSQKIELPAADLDASEVVPWTPARRKA
jgi:hypothetical protein